MNIQVKMIAASFQLHVDPGSETGSGPSYFQSLMDYIILHHIIWEYEVLFITRFQSSIQIFMLKNCPLKSNEITTEEPVHRLLAGCKLYPDFTTAPEGSSHQLWPCIDWFIDHWMDLWWIERPLARNISSLMWKQLMLLLLMLAFSIALACPSRPSECSGSCYFL